MLAGHLAVALASKKVERVVPLGRAVAAAFGLHLLWPLFLLMWIETVQINPGDTAFTHLAFVSYPWSHSLVMSVVWATAGSLLAAGIWLYTRVTRARDATGKWSLVALLALIGAVWVTQPWSPPPPSAIAVAWGGLVLWLLVPWAAWIERHRGEAGVS